MKHYKINPLTDVLLQMGLCCTVGDFGSTLRGLLVYI